MLISDAGGTEEVCGALSTSELELALELNDDELSTGVLVTAALSDRVELSGRRVTVDAELVSSEEELSLDDDDDIVSALDDAVALFEALLATTLGVNKTRLWRARGILRRHDASLTCWWRSARWTRRLKSLKSLRSRSRSSYFPLRYSTWLRG
jgi:hypothetical protein